MRNIPAKCDAEILRNFLHSRGLTHCEIKMQLFPNGKSRGFAIIRTRDRFGVQKIIDNIHGQFLPGFGKTTPLCLEPLRSSRRPRCIQKQTFVPAEPPQPWPCGACHFEFHGHDMTNSRGTFNSPRVQAETSPGLSTIGTGVPQSEIGIPAVESLAGGRWTAFPFPSETAPHESTIKCSQTCTVLRHEPAYTAVLSTEGKLSFFL